MSKVCISWLISRVSTLVNQNPCGNPDKQMHLWKKKGTKPNIFKWLKAGILCVCLHEQRAQATSVKVSKVNFLFWNIFFRM